MLIVPPRGTSSAVVMTISMSLSSGSGCRVELLRYAKTPMSFSSLGSGVTERRRPARQRTRRRGGGPLLVPRSEPTGGAVRINPYQILGGRRSAAPTGGPPTATTRTPPRTPAPVLSGAGGGAAHSPAWPLTAAGWRRYGCRRGIRPAPPLLRSGRMDFLVTGGTDGVGRAITRHALAHGHRVMAVGHTAEKGDAWLAEAAEAGAADRAVFFRADLRLVTENTRTLDAVRRWTGQVDRLVLCAQRYQTRIGHTAEGLERNFALSYLSRFLLSFGLLPQLRAAGAPLVVNVCGTGTPVGRLRWNDLQFTSGGRGFQALMQAARATDLLGVAFAAHPTTGGLPFVLYNPDVVRTNLQREIDQPWRMLAAVTLALRGKPVEEGVRPLLRLLADPPTAALTAFRAAQEIDLQGSRYARSYRPADAQRLLEETNRLLVRLGHPELGAR
ncbi:SDR family NAD(P)-dependent oxidoreductase [Micromonospora wenchangensis]